MHLLEQLKPFLSIKKRLLQSFKRLLQLFIAEIQTLKRFL
jgi:hypothetical protein